MFGSNSIIGRRPTQQDELCLGVRINPNAIMYGVFDGHGGRGGGRCSKLAARKLKNFISNGLAKSKCSDMNNLNAVESAVCNAFKEFDGYLQKLPKVDGEEAKPQTSKFSRWFSSPPSADFEQSGSCACVVLETDQNFIVANLGDSRAILSDGKRITSDQTTLSISEVDRVYAAGGWTIQNRLYGSLIPTRTFGDFNFKRIGKNGELALESKPEIHVIPRTPDMPQFLILMCDGVHDVFKDSELAKLVELHSQSDLDDIARAITDEAFRRGSKDNISCIVIRTDRSRIPKSSSLSSIDGQTDSDVSSQCDH